MQAESGTKNESPSLLYVVALLTDLPGHRLARGQVGTIVEQLDERSSSSATIKVALTPSCHARVMIVPETA
jgi:hypothetical protein